jgi:hypothetical protein
MRSSQIFTIVRLKSACKNTIARAGEGLIEPVPLTCVRDRVINTAVLLRNR